MTVINVPQGLRDIDIINTMKDEYGILISGCFDVLADKVIRLGHMGNNARVEKVADMLSAFTKALNDLGFSCRCDMKESFYRSL